RELVERHSHKSKAMKPRELFDCQRFTLPVPWRRRAAARNRVAFRRYRYRVGEKTMPLATLRQVLDEAAKGGYGVGAFNVNNMEQLQGIVSGAQEVQAPVIVQASRGAIAYAGPQYLRNLVLAAVESAPEIPIVLHLDHGDKPETCLMAIELGFTSVM